MLDIEEKAVEQALSGGYNLKFHESFDQTSDDGKQMKFEIDIKEGGEEDSKNKKHHFFSDDEESDEEDHASKSAD